MWEEEMGEMGKAESAWQELPPLQPLYWNLSILTLFGFNETFAYISIKLSLKVRVEEL